MKLDRNINPDGTGKYALIEMRKLTAAERHYVMTGEGVIAGVPRTAIDTGGPGPRQFFVMKYGDPFTAPALRAYAQACQDEAERIGDKELEEFASEIWVEARAAERCIHTIPS